MMKCAHCNNQTLNNERFCCSGCRVANEIMSSLNLLQYYKFCTEIYNSSPTTVTNMINEVDYSEYATFNKSDNGVIGEVDLIIEGIHCGSCIWLIENALKKQPNVLGATINLSTKVLNLKWIITESKEKSKTQHRKARKKRELKQLIELIYSLGYKALPFVANKNYAEQQDQQRYLLKCIIIAAFVWVQNMMISMGIWANNWTNDMGEYSRLIMNLIAGAITIPCIYYASIPFFRSAIAAARNKASNMDVPISIAIVATLMISVQETILNSSMTYYEAASSLVFALLISRYLDLKVRNSAYQSAQTLLHSQVTVASVLNTDGSIKLVHSNKIQLGDVVVVQNGERIPIDGAIIEGEALIDNSIITGESIPQKYRKKDYVFAGSLNLEGQIKIKAEKKSKNTILAQIIQLMHDAERNKSKYRTIADRVAGWYTPAVLGIGLFTFALWLYHGTTIATSLLHSISVLIITCPCALGLAVPAVQIAAITKMMKSGIILKRSDALERLANFNMIAFDKTGTLTVGKPQWINSDILDSKAKKLALGLALHSKHHVCQAIVASTNNDKAIEISDIEEKQSQGIEGKYTKKKNKQVTIRLGKYEWCVRNLDQKISSNQLEEKTNSNQESNEYIIHSWLAIVTHNLDGAFEAVKLYRLCFADKLKPEAYSLIEYIKTKVKRLIILSGDNESNVKHIANLLGIEEYYANTTPEQKYDMINQWKREHQVFMIGDGLNDAAALKNADVSASPATAMVISHNQADIIWQGDLNSIQLMIETAKQGLKLMKQNFALSLLYNVIAIPFAVLGFATPIAAAVFMGLSSIVVVLNAMRIR